VQLQAAFQRCFSVVLSAGGSQARCGSDWFFALAVWPVGHKRFAQWRSS
jgi:hypothetical protein